MRINSETAQAGVQPVHGDRATATRQEVAFPQMQYLHLSTIPIDGLMRHMQSIAQYQGNKLSGERKTMAFGILRAMSPSFHQGVSLPGSRRPLDRKLVVAQSECIALSI